MIINAKKSLVKIKMLAYGGNPSSSSSSSSYPFISFISLTSSFSYYIFYRSQMPNSYNGKVLRLDPLTGNGIGPVNGLKPNPYYNAQNPASVESRTWAKGVRNSYDHLIPSIHPSIYLSIYPSILPLVSFTTDFVLELDRIQTFQARGLSLREK